MAELAKMPKYSTYINSGIDWIGNVPATWKIYTLKRTVDGCTNGLWGSDPKGNDEIIVLRVADFNRNTLNVLDDKLTYRAIPVKERQGRLLKKGDLLIEKSGGGDKTLVGCVVRFDKDYEAVTSNFVAKMTPQKGFDSRFLKYVFSTIYDQKITYKSIKQTTGIQNLDSASYLNEKFPFPILPEQITIANFLDLKSTQIDEAIAIKEKQIELLKERKQIIIQQAVTQGLNLNAPTKDSGVDWIGEIPEHWAYEPIKHSLKGIIDCEHKTAPFVDETDYFVVRTTNVKGGKLQMAGAKYTHEKGFKEWTRRGVPKVGDVLLTREAPAGEACLVPENINLCLGQRMVWLKINRERLIPEFAISLIYSSIGRTYIDFLSSGSTVLHFNMADINNIPVVLPPLKEQQELVEFIRNESGKVDDGIEIQIQQIEKLKEYKTTLINSAVTGKIKVPGVV
ncbi:restriction endonuclease subunit S [Pseudoalteromonas atlantica]|uniref:restriction endonuclease subunit S n=1 Tax=Pseudoalteromonas atlantica TaxID=288 RepID=UPI00373576FD